MAAKYRVEFEDHQQDLLWLECDEAGTVTDCGPFHQGMYIGKITVDVAQLPKERTVFFSRLGRDNTFKWPAARVFRDGELFLGSATA